MSGPAPLPKLPAGGESDILELGGRVKDLASETRSILAPASPLTHQFGMSESVPVIPTNAIPPFPPSFTDPALLLHALNSSAFSVDMNPRSSKPSTPRPETADSTSSGHQRSPEVGRPLNVTDALSYLDAVKNQFHESPDVYNQFLDIMKDFKSQVIDTPGVIQRVSRLFHGNPYLIQGFNTFLPMGYRIDISVDPSDPNVITVTTPLGTTTQNTNTNAPIPRNGRELDPMLPGTTYVNPSHYPITSSLLQNAANAPGSRSHTPHLFQAPSGPPAPYDPVYSPGIQGPQTTAAAASFLNYLNNKNPVEKQPAGEFNHAIQYLNKIKARYGDDPNTYKQFLDILQTFQKEQRHSPDAQVYVQVQMLFKDAPDLLAEFKDFLPEAMPGAMGANGVPIMPQSSSASWGPGESSPPHVPVKKPAQAPKRNRKRVPEKEVTPVPPSKPAPSRQAKKVKHSHHQDNEPASFSSYPVPHSPSQTHAYPVAQGPPPVHSHGGPHGVHHLSEYQTNTSPGKLLFFDRAKKSLENQEYDEFLKLLNLFSKDIIDIQTLVERAKVFLGDGDLMTDFKDLVGCDDRDKVEKGPPGSIRTGPPELPTALPVDDGEGPSYRKLPPSETQLACSGRDELCRSVLNDEWVSHPTWASEESGFVAHKKTPFEEAVHRSEEERHEYHVQIEALVRTIAVLEPLNSRIDEMTHEERSHFRLKPDFGGSGMSIYHRIIKKIYGRDMGLEVIQALQDCPSVAVPVVLNRLKAKDEEWRRAQREWSRTWKEVDCKNFYKSLDHQGTNFKQNDKKNITAKYFVTDIQSIKKQQLKKWERKGVKVFTQGSVGHQLEYSFKNTAVLHDAVKMVYTYLEHSHAQYSPQERRGVEKFLRSFVPTLCTLSEAEFWATAPLDGTAGAGEEESGHDVNRQPEGSRSGRKSTGAGGQGHSTPIPANDLRKKLLKTAQEKASKRDLRGASAVGSRAESPAASGHGSPRLTRADDDSSDPHDIWIKESGSKATMESLVSPSDKERPFFANTTFYTLIRLLELLYSRLLMCYEIGAQYAAQKHATLLANRVAVDLGLDDPNGPASVLKQTMDHLGKPAADDANIVYMYLLTACEKLFDNELDQGTFEEHMRWFFGTKAYTLFTLDKSIIALIKQVQTILGDNKCQELWSLLKSAQNSKNISIQDIIRYRREAERHVGQDDHLYRLQWVRETRCIRVSLCSANEPSVETDGSDIARWREYVNTYVMTHPTEWVPETKKESNPVFLRRCVRVGEESQSTASFIEDRIKIRVSFPKYKLVYEAGCEDMIVNKEGGELRTRVRQREEERRKSEWLFGIVVILIFVECLRRSLSSTPSPQPWLARPSSPHGVQPPPASSYILFSYIPPTSLQSIAKRVNGWWCKTCLAHTESLSPFVRMAKPLPVASPGAPGGSKSTIGGGKGISEPSHRPRHRRHRPSKSPLSSFTPSSGLLILLASVASASTVSGSPAPPSFLCPSIGTEDDEASSINKRAPPSSSVTVTSTPSESNDVLLPRHVPDRYRQDADGVWRRMGTYTLYGSTVSACSGTCRQPTNAVSAVDDQIQVSGNTDTTNNTTTLNQLDDIRDSLPPGWKPVPKPNASRTPLILAVSLVLAFLICSFIIGCLFWRKTVKKNHRSHDVEAKAKRKKSAAKEESIIAEKEHKSKQKIWARATARWKANVRYTARQRRGKRFSSRASAQQSTLSLDRSRSRLAGSTSSIRSAASSRRSSTSSVRNPIHDEEVNPTSPTSVEIPSSPPSSPPTQATANNPPAYQHRGQIPPIIISSGDTTVDGYPTTTPQFGRSRRPSHSSNYSASAITNDGQMVEISPTPLHAAHVATDDKSLLARLAELASSPPTDDCSTSAGTSEVQVSAPVWQDDDIEDFAPELAPSPSQSSTTPTLFPPPPSKELLAASQFYSYPFSFEEMESLEAECGPSAPPFEEGASPPLQDSHLLVPSAPPLLEDNDRIWDVHPSAPEWDDSSPAIDSCEENVAGQDHDRIATESDVLRPSAPSSSPPLRTPTPPIGPSSPCPANDSSITLPGYRP